MERSPSDQQRGYPHTGEPELDGTLPQSMQLELQTLETRLRLCQARLHIVLEENKDKQTVIDRQRALIAGFCTGLGAPTPLSSGRHGPEKPFFECGQGGFLFTGRPWEHGGRSAEPLPLGEGRTPPLSNDTRRQKEAVGARGAQPTPVASRLLGAGSADTSDSTGPARKKLRTAAAGAQGTEALHPQAQREGPPSLEEVAWRGQDRQPAPPCPCRHVVVVADSCKDKILRLGHHLLPTCPLQKVHYKKCPCPSPNQHMTDCHVLASTTCQRCRLHLQGQRNTQNKKAHLGVHCGGLRWRLSLIQAARGRERSC